MDHDRPSQPARPPTPPPPPPPPRVSYSAEDSPPRVQVQRVPAPPVQEYGPSSASHTHPISRDDNDSVATVTRNPVPHQNPPPQNPAAVRRPTSDGTLLHPSSSQERLVASPSQSVSFHSPPRGHHEQLRNERLSRNADGALPPLPRSSENFHNPLQGLRRASVRHSTVGEYHEGNKDIGEGGRPLRSGSGVDWIVPLHDEKNGVLPSRGGPRSVEQRLAPTLETARAQRDRFAAKAKKTGRTLSIAIGLQVLLGSLTTGLSALGAVKNNTAIATTILGAMTTVVASYLARTRGSNEPELSITRVKDLEKFIREVEAYMLDFGQYAGEEHDAKIAAFRTSFEEILGNNGDGYGDSKERRLAPPV